MRRLTFFRMDSHSYFLPYYRTAVSLKDLGSSDVRSGSDVLFLFSRTFPPPLLSHLPSNAPVMKVSRVPIVDSCANSRLQSDLYSCPSLPPAPPFPSFFFSSTRQHDGHASSTSTACFPVYGSWDASPSFLVRVNPFDPPSSSGLRFPADSIRAAIRRRTSCPEKAVGSPDIPHPADDSLSFSFFLPIPFHAMRFLYASHDME